MLTRIIDLPDNVLGIEASGEITADDYEAVLVPALEQKLHDSDRLRLLYVLGDGFDGITAGAAWEDAKVGLRHMSRFDRIAVVTDVDWVRHAVKAFGFAMPGDVRVFEGDDLKDAREWISEPASQGKLEFKLIAEQGVLVLSPHGELEAADFERVAEGIDAEVSDVGTLRGVVIVANAFPGWHDLGAMSAHFRFVREHRKHMTRLAVVTDDRAMSALPRLAKHLVMDEARHFSASERDEALAWASQA